ncbi:winged helix-turn-helix transcriptional regulator [Candidatus Bathyarchaeota archaeon]|nr:winged helix-turn-helix transcriptional regulator [Candidatus Bathyarchaeota archaeon]
MPREEYHPNAYLTDFKNVKLGLKARTLILNFLERSSTDAKTIAKETGLPYNVVMHHLKLLETKGIAKRESKRPSVWALTGLGQKRLG